MSYTKNTWASGDIITAEKLNHMEDGIANSGGTLKLDVANVDVENSIITYDKTWQQVNDALQRGDYVSVQMLPEEGTVDYERIYMTQTTEASGGVGYTAEYMVYDVSYVLIAETPQDYLTKIID